MDRRISELVSDVETQRRERFGWVRYILCGLLFVNCFLLYAMRLNLSLSITAMVNSTSSNEGNFSSDSCRKPDFAVEKDPTITKDGFAWSQNQQAMLIYAFFVGYLVSQVPGGYFAQRYSLKWVIGLGLGLCSAFTCLTELAAHTSLSAFVALRVLEGVCEGVVFPSVYVFVSKWIPIQEQGFLLSVILAGPNIGTVVTMPVSAFLCDSAWGWPGSFYVFGILGIVFTVVWLALAADSPEHHRWISVAERDYILENRPTTDEETSKSVPWKEMLLSSAVWFLLLQRLGSGLNYLMILTELPSYLKDMFGINIVKNGLLNGAMIMGLTITLVTTGWIADKILAKNLASKNVVRKCFIAASTLAPPLCMMIVPLVGCNYDVVVTLMFLNCVFAGFSGGGDALLCLDVAHKYAGTLQGVVGVVTSLAGVLAPLMVGLATDNNNTLHQWNLVFYSLAAVCGAAALVFLIFGSTEEQEWAKQSTVDDQAPLVDRKD